MPPRQSADGNDVRTRRETLSSAATRMMREFYHEHHPLSRHTRFGGMASRDCTPGGIGGGKDDDCDDDDDDDDDGGHAEETNAVVDSSSTTTTTAGPIGSHEPFPSSSCPPSPSCSRASTPVSSLLARSWLELREQSHTSLPALIGMVLYKIPWLVSLVFVGRIGPGELAAAALASALCDVTGMSLSVGLSSAIATLAAQARGELLAAAEGVRADAEFKRRVLEQAWASMRWRKKRGSSRSGLLSRFDSDQMGWAVGAETGTEKGEVELEVDEEGAGGAARFACASEEGQRNAHTPAATAAAAARPGIVAGAEQSANSARHLVVIPPVTEYGSLDRVSCEDDESEVGRRFSNILRGSSHFRSFQSIASVDSDADEDPPLLPMVYLYRGIFVQLCLVIPVGIWWLRGVYPLLIALGQSDDLSLMTQTYLRILTPGLLSYSVNWTLTAWLQAVEMADVPPWAALVGGLLHVPFNLFFIHVCGLGWLGVGVATVTFQIVQPALMLLYLFGTKRGYERLLEQLGAKGVGRSALSFSSELYAAVSSLWGIYQYLELAIPGIIVVSEWWASEVAIFLSGRLEPNPQFALSAMAIYQSINSACFMLPYGLSVGGSTRVGNLLGANDPEGAALASSVCVLTSATLSCLTATFLYFTPHSFLPSLFTTDEDVIRETSSTISLLSVYVFADGIQVALNGIIKRCGRQCITVPIVLCAYWVVGVPLAYYLSLVKNKGYMCQDNYFCGIVGLVGGMTIGTWVHFLLLLVTIVGTTNWENEAEKAQNRLALEIEKRSASSVDNGNWRFREHSEANKLREEIIILHRRTQLRLGKDDDTSFTAVKAI